MCLIAGGVTTESVFEIVRVQGMIKLAALVPANMVLYNLNVTAIDDGSCCTKPSSLNSTTVVPIDIKDVNNNSPHFPDCSSYHPTIMENEPTGSPVIQVILHSRITIAQGYKMKFKNILYGELY